MKVIGILSELPEVGVGKERRRGEESRAIERGDKSLKRLLITLVRIWVRESMTCLSGTMRNNLAKSTTEILLLKFLIRSALMSLVIVMIKFASGLLPGQASD